MPRISVRHLQMMQMVTRTGNVSDAAVMLGLTQSALSHRIREAERLLGTALFIRRNKKLVPTSAGERLLHSASLVLAELERAEMDIAKYSAGIEETVKLGLDHRAGSHWIPALYQTFSLEAPSAELEIVTDVQPDPLFCLRNGRIDMCILSGVRPQAAYNSLFLFKDELVVVYSHTHEFANKHSIQSQDFEHQIYVTDTITPEHNREYEQVFSPSQVFPDQVVRVGRTENILAFINAGKGISVLPRWTLSAYLKHTDLRFSSINGGTFIDWYLFFRKDENTDSAVRRLARSIQRLIPNESP